MKYDLKNISLLLKALGNPHEQIKFIHIAGTNGKGGTASFLASILMEHKLKTGLFTSPHILRYNERIRIDGRTITDKYIMQFLDVNKRLIQKVKPSFFEVNTAMAFKYFAEKKVDVAIIESGLGGRLDSTNIISPELIIITQIAIDHTEYLGKTLKSIAKEKLGIVKPEVDVIAADRNPELRKMFRQKIENKRLYFLDEYSGYKIRQKDIAKVKFDSTYKFLNKKYEFTLSSPLPGLYQARNITTAVLGSLLFLRKAGIRFSSNAVRTAVSRVRTNSGYRARFERVKIGGISFILDVSHNPAGIKEAMSNFEKVKPDVIIFAMMNDKDYRSAIRVLLGAGSNIIFTRPEYKRALPAEVLHGFSSEIKPESKDKFHLVSNVMEAIRSAKTMAGNKGTVLVIGSFFLVSEAIKALRMQNLFS